MHQSFSVIVLVLVIVCWLRTLKLVVAFVAITLFVLGLFLEVWMKSLAVVGHMIVFVIVDVIKNIKRDLI